MAKERFYQDWSRVRGNNATDLHDLRKRILAMIQENGPQLSRAIEDALIEFSNHTAIRRAIRYAAEDGLITRERPSQPWRLAPKKP